MFPTADTDLKELKTFKKKKPFIETLEEIKQRTDRQCYIDFLKQKFNRLLASTAESLKNPGNRSLGKICSKLSKLIRTAGNKLNNPKFNPEKIIAQIKEETLRLAREQGPFVAKTKKPSKK